MPVTVHGDGLPLTAAEVAALWSAVQKQQGVADTDIGLSVVSDTEIQRLNRDYHQQDKPTNVLTFSYAPEEHDVALCLSVVEREAEERGTSLRDYAALVITHALLHVTGLDHEASEAEEQVTHDAEASVLKSCGFTSDHL